MKRSSASVIVIGDPASQHRDPVECLLARGATMKTCTSRQPAVQAQADTAILTAARRQGVGFVDVRGWLCAPALATPHPYLCPLVVNQTITDVDRGHLSKTYTLELEPVFRRAFREQLFR